MDSPHTDHDPHQGLTPFGGDPEQLRHAEDPAMGDAAQRVRCAEVTERHVSVAALADIAADPRCGAVVTFDGAVRDHDGGKGVHGLEYSQHPAAGDVIEQVAAEIAGRYPDVIIAVSHRVGSLAIGETALGCAVAAPHRKQAFAACDDLVDTVKRRLPIWKHQRFADGTDEWVGALG